RRHFLDLFRRPVLQCRFCRTLRSICLSRSWKNRRPFDLSRRQFLQYCQGVPLVFYAAGASIGSLSSPPGSSFAPTLPSDLPLHPEYRVKRGIDSVLRKVPAGFDEFITEKYQDEIQAIFQSWSAELSQSPASAKAIAKAMDPSFQGASLLPK